MMTRNKKLNAKPLHNHGQEKSIPGNNHFPTPSAAGRANNLQQILPEDVEGASNQHKHTSMRVPAKNTTVTSQKSVHSSTTHKRPRQDEMDGSDVQPPSRKKGKLNLQQHPQNVNLDSTLAQNGEKNPMENRLPRSAKHAAPQIPHEVRHLTSKYDLMPMSIISSSKMEQKVRNVLDRVSNFSFSDPKSKPGVVILHAEARNASKLVTIAEVSKKNIEKDKGTWWQYTKLEGQVMEMKEKPRRAPPPAHSEKTLAMWEDEQSNTAVAVEDQADVAMGGFRVEPAVDEPADEANNTAPPQEEEEEEEGEAFETMSAPPNNHRGTAQPGSAEKKVRAVPIMTIYLARVPVPGLRDLYG